MKAIALGAGTLALLVVLSTPAGAYNRAPSTLRPGGTFALAGPGIATPDAELVYGYQPQPPDCVSTVPASCDRYHIHLDLPPLGPSTQVRLDLTLTWPHDGSQLELFVYDDAPVNQNGDYTPQSEITEGRSPAVSHIIDPTTTDFNALVVNIGNLPNRGYRLAGRLTTAALPVPVDHSLGRATTPTVTARTVAEPPARFTGRASRAAVAAPAAALFPAGAPAAVGTLAPAHPPRSGGASRRVWVLGAISVAVVAAAATLLGRRVRPRLVWTLLVPFAATTLALGAAGTVVTVRYLRADARTKLVASLDRQSAAASSALTERVGTIGTAARFAANVDGLPEALKANDAGGAARALASVVAVRPDVDLLVVSRPDGSGLVELTRQGRGYVQGAGATWMAASPVASVLARAADPTDGEHAGPLVANGNALLGVAAPVQADRAGPLLGAILVGERADATVTTVARSVGSAVALYDSAGTLIAASASAPATAPPSAALEKARIAGRAVAWASRPVELLGSPSGTIAAALGTGPAYAGVGGAALRLVGLVVLVIVALAAIGVVVVRSVLGQVRPLVEANRRVAAGDLAARAEVRSRDELGELAAGFNAMAEQLEAEQRHLEEQVAERTTQLVRLAEARAEVLAAISHDFRTPIFAIMRHGELMTNEGFHPPDDRWMARFGATILDSSQLLLDRVDEILDLARMGAVGLELHRQPLRLGELMDAIEGPAAAVARSAGISIDVVRPREDAAVEGDLKRLRSAVLNLVSNGVKYNRPGGRVTVGARARQGSVELWVSDTGVGIPGEVADLVFEPFYRVPGVDAVDGQPSTGLGLAVVRQVVDAHSGTITYTTGVGVGTTFTMSLPRLPARRGRRRAPTDLVRR